MGEERGRDTERETEGVGEETGRDTERGDWGDSARGRGRWVRGVMVSRGGGGEGGG